jgi:predicted nicotinamide N-methyase
VKKIKLIIIKNITNKNKQLKETDLKTMNKPQKEVVLHQWKKHQHNDIKIDYNVSGQEDILKDFVIKKGVWNPFLASGGYHARYFFYHTDLFYKKDVLEIGSGTGLMSVVMAKFGASSVIASDISELAVENTKINIEKFDLENIVKVKQSDLFENINEKVDLITWMIPFFSENLEESDTISNSMIMSIELFERFLKEAPKYLNPGGVIVIPSFSLGGKNTDPSVVGKKFGYEIKTTWIHESYSGIQKGMLYMHELRIPNTDN